MAISKFDRRERTRGLADADSALARKESERRHRRVGWVVFFIVVIAAFAWLWHYLGQPPVEPME